ncbi:MAG: hypothetical protein BWY54_00192 [Candidatus Dependentiae bacterium ADurb.Bin331]|nr:MAG: hypothetical protein BWY54_00192 [Candidatus Dependentiae bacterium ADurb.Bin331]
MKQIYFSSTMSSTATIFFLIMLPIYWYYYGPANFLWLSDIGLFLTIGAFWLQAPILISMACVGILPQEIAWNIDFIIQLLTGFQLLGLSNYMFDAQLPLFLRALSLFHIGLPLIWIWCVMKFGYARSAARLMTYLIWVILSWTYLFTDPTENINWVFMPSQNNWQFISPFAWFLFVIIGIPLFIILPMHLLLKRITKRFV